jgi:hypothetical protein
MTDIERQQFEIDPADLALLQACAAEFQIAVQVEEAAEGTTELAPLVVVALIGSAAFVAGTVAYFQDRRKGGQMIDLRPNAVKIAWRDRGVVYGLIVIVTEDGKVRVEVKEPKTFFGQVIKDVLDALTNIGQRGTSAVAAGASSAVGDRAAVFTEPTART